MPFADLASVPPDVRDRFKGHCAEVWRTTWNDTFTAHGDEGRAWATAELAAKACMEAGAMDHPNTKAMVSTPTTEAAMRSHLTAAPPDGHGMAGPAAADMPMAGMESKHTAMHADGAPHIHPFTKNLKFTGSHTIEGLGIPFGGPLTGGKDFDGEFFDKSTDLCLEWFSERPILYDHGTNGETKTSVIGRQVKAEVTDDGIWVRGELDKNSRYREAVGRLIEKDALAFSSGAMPHLVKVGKSGHIERWPWVELSATPTAANSFATIYAVKSTDAIAHLAEINDIPAPVEAALKALDEWAITRGGSEHEPFTEQGQRVLADLSGFVTRVHERTEARGKVGRVLSAANRDLLISYLEQLDAFSSKSDEIRRLLAETDPDSGKAALAAMAEFEAIQARLLGVAI